METNIPIKRENALKAYNEGCSDVKKVLNNLFGPETFRPVSIKDRISSFTDICELNGTTEEDFFRECAECRLRPHEVANRQEEMICAAYNEGWIPDYDNSDEEKWELWFFMNQPGFRLFGASYGRTHSNVGARLVFKAKDLALDAAAKFLPIYEASRTFKRNAAAASQPMAAVSNDPFERDCKKLGLDHKAILPDLSRVPEKYRAAVLSYFRLLVATDAKRDGHVFDYQDSSEEKWYPWWDMEVDENNPSGFRLDGARYVRTASSVGARLSLRDEKEVREVAAEFEADYKNMMKQ